MKDLKSMTPEQKERLYIKLLEENRRLHSALGKTNGSILDLITSNPELLQ